VGRWALAVAGLVLAMPASAQSIIDFDDWMQRIEDASLSLQKRIDARDHARGAHDAREIEDLYARMEKFFRVREAHADAIRLSKEGKDLAVAIRVALAAGKLDAARARTKDLRRDCRTCHLQFKPL
jgi:hypothetical protein